MTKETLVNTAWLQIESFFFSHNFKYFLVKLLAQLTKWEKVSYSTIITVFLINKMAACCLGIQSEGKAAVEDTQYSGIITS